MIQDEAAIQALRQRRAHWFFGDSGARLPPGTGARWRISAGDPHGWQANMIGFVQAPFNRLGDVLDVAIAFFCERGADTWVDADEWTPLWHAPELLAARGFVLEDDWIAMLCRQLQPVAPTSVVVRAATTNHDLELAAWISEQSESHDEVPPGSPVVKRRFERYWSELHEWRTQFALAELDAMPVATARLTDETLPVVVGVATLPPARGRGAASAVTAYLTEKALLRQGASALYVQHESQAARIYRRLGYNALFRTRAWRRPCDC